jgi:hypothetical protein
MPFGIPSEDFHGGFGLPRDEDDYDPYTGKYAFVPPDDEVDDEEYETAAQEVYDNLVHSLVEAGGEIRQLKQDKATLIFYLKEVNKWLEYFITTDPDNIYADEARTTVMASEMCLMDITND